jgi:hypothetical protein
MAKKKARAPNRKMKKTAKKKNPKTKTEVMLL